MIIIKTLLAVISIVIFIVIACFIYSEHREKVHNKCYIEMLKCKDASNGRCKGLAGGNRYTGYLHEDCIDCPYFGWEEV